MTTTKTSTSRKKKKKRLPKIESLDDSFQPKSWDEVETGQKIEPEKLKSYRSPKLHKTFTARWNEYIPDIVKRENFKRGHLAQLAILCDLYVEYEKLEKIVDQKGYTYKTSSKFGVQLKPRPEVLQMNRVRAEIRNYSKTLGLILVKDKHIGTDQQEEEEWS